MTEEKLLKFILSLSVAIPAVVGLLRIRQIHPAYYPFLVYLMVSLLNELLVGLVLINFSKESRIINWSLFNLFEGLILLVQFYGWKLFEHNKSIFVSLLILFAGIWLLENFVWSDIYSFNALFIIGCSFVLVLLSIQTINHIIVHQSRSPLSRNAIFIICVTLIIYFVYNIFVYTLQAKGIGRTDKLLMNKVFSIKVYVNTVTNLLFGIAVFLIPFKNKSLHFFYGPDSKK